MKIQNLVSTTLPAEDKTAIMDAIQTLVTKMPFLISLTNDQRRGGMKLGDKTVGFVDKVVDYSQSNPDFVPAYLDLTEFNNDYLLIKDLSEILRVLQPVVQNIEDTTTEAGIEALGAAMVFYNSVKSAAKQGVPGAKSIYDDLQKRFPGASGNSAANNAEVPA